MVNSKEKTLFTVVVYLTLLIAAGLGGILSGQAGIDILARAGYMIVLGAIFLMVLFWNEECIWKQIPFKGMYLSAFVVSVLLTAVASQYSVGSYWMVLLIVAVCTQKFSVMAVSYGMLMISYVIQVLGSPEGTRKFAFYLIMGIALVLVFSMIQSMKEMPYVAVILLALSTAMQILLYRFDLRDIWKARYSFILELASALFFVLLWTILQFVLSDDGQTTSEEKSLTDTLLAYLEDGYELLEELKEHKELYHHSYEISRISSLAARKLGCDATLSAVGGMYHEIGRLREGDDYVANGIQLAKEYQFPDRLTAILCQHNAGYEIPKSQEAAIVMLSDNIISTSEYLKKSGKRSAITDEKLVNSIFDNRIAKGNLKESGLTEAQIEVLKTFYISIERHGYQYDDTDGKGNG